MRELRIDVSPCYKVYSVFIQPLSNVPFSDIIPKEYPKLVEAVKRLVPQSASNFIEAILGTNNFSGKEMCDIFSDIDKITFYSSEYDAFIEQTYYVFKELELSDLAKRFDGLLDPFDGLNKQEIVIDQVNPTCISVHNEFDIYSHIHFVRAYCFYEKEFSCSSIVGDNSTTYPIKYDFDFEDKSKDLVKLNIFS